MSRRQPWIIAVMLAACAPAVAQDFSGACTALLPPDRGVIVIDDLETPLSANMPAVLAGTLEGGFLEIRTVAENQAAFYLADAGSELGLYLDSESTLTLGPSGDPRRRLGVKRGEVVISFLSRDNRPLVISLPDGWVRLEFGLVVIKAAEGTVDVALANGLAARFQGELPEGDPLQARDGETLEERPSAGEAASAMIERLTRAGLSDAPTDWLAKAESGDLIPTPQPGQAARQVAASFSAGQPVNQPVGVNASTAVTGTSVAATVTTPIVTQAQAFLVSQNPATVLVGSRLERARIIGSPGTTGAGTGIRFNPQVRGPLGLIGR